MARCINNANLCIFKRNGYNVSSTDCLRSIYSIPLTLMYRTKDAMVTSLGLYIKNNPHKINGQVFYRSDEDKKRVLDFLIDGKKVLSTHMPQSLSYIGQICTSGAQLSDRIDDNVGSVRLDTDYRRPLEMFILQLEKIKADEKAKSDEKANQEFLQKVQNKINNGDIILLFGDLDKPCAIRVQKSTKGNKKFKFGYNAIPNAYNFGKENYLLKNADGGFALCELRFCSGDEAYFEDEDTRIIYVVTPNGEIMQENVIKSIVKRILREYKQYGIHKNNYRKRGVDW